MPLSPGWGENCWKAGPLVLSLTDPASEEPSPRPVAHEMLAASFPGAAWGNEDLASRVGLPPVCTAPVAADSLSSRQTRSAMAAMSAPVYT